MESAAPEKSAALAIPTTLKALVEGLIFAAQEPLTLPQIKTIYQGDGRPSEQRQIDSDVLRRIVDDLNKEYRNTDRPYRIVQVAGGYQFATLPEYAMWIGKLYREQGRRKLSQSGIESLAIIAYKQPITKAEVEKIRGVNCDYVLKTLLEKELVTIVGRAETVGRPLLYGTTREFLKHFGLNDITDLPRPREIEEILGESQFETERRMLEAQAGAEAMKKEAEEFKSRLPHIPRKKPELEKSVEIVPRKRSREIRLVSGSEQKSLESVGQEPIAFDVPSSTDIPPSAGSALPPVEMSAGDAASSAPVAPAPVPVPDEIRAEELHASEVPEIVPPDDGMMSAAESVEVMPAGTEEPQMESASVQPEETTQTRPRWRSWKEKIQGFIRKLFA